MSNWSEVDAYLIDLLVGPDEALEQALAANKAAGLPAIDVAPNQGKLLYLLARMIGARRILEIGTLGGYSTIWLAKALPEDGRVVSFELEPAHADIARRNLARAGFDGIAEVRTGVALDLLPALETEEPFDLVFIDADKPNNPGYLRWAKKLARKGAVIILDNVVREGAVIDADSTDEKVQGSRAGLALIAEDPTLTATALQTIGSKGHDGFAIMIVE
jgi:predicted O-methyltransferase YrrM